MTGVQTCALPIWFGAVSDGRTEKFRPFVEKMFAIHGKVQLFKRDGTPLGSYARHYYDLYQLAAQAQVLAMLKSTEYSAIKSDYDQISRTHFDRSYFHPDGMSFANSDALFPPSELAAILDGPHPSWTEIQGRFMELRGFL